MDLVAQARVAGYEPALQKVLTLPDEFKQRSGLDVDAANQYLQGIADVARNALDAGKALPEAGTRSVMYEQSLRDIAERLQRDGSDATKAYGDIVQKALQIADQFKGLRR